MTNIIFRILVVIILSVSSVSAFPQSLKERAENGDMKAQYEYAQTLEPRVVFYGDDLNTPEYQNALKWYLKSAEQGYIPAQNQVAYFYYYGKGTDVNYKEAFKWYEKSANAGDAGAIFNLGILYEYGKGTEKSSDKAFQLYKKAYELDHKDAILRLARCYYYQIGTIRDYNKAFSLFQKAAENGNKNADYYLGLCYLNGNGISKDSKLAASHFDKAADDNNVDAQFELGKLYLKGYGVEKDSIMAAELFLHSASGGWCTPSLIGHHYEKNNLNKEALSALKNLSNLDTSSNQHYFLALLGCYYDKLMDFSNAEKYYKMAVEKNSILGVIELGLMYFYISANDEDSESYKEDHVNELTELENWILPDRYSVKKYLKEKVWSENDNTAYWLEEAIKYGFGNFEYGMMSYNLYNHLFYAYMLGIGVDKNLDKAIDLAYKMYTDENCSFEDWRYGDAEQALMVGIENVRYAPHALKVFQKLNEYSNTSETNKDLTKKVSCSGLGKVYYWGYGGPKRDYNKAFIYLDQAAQLDDAESMRLLSTCYRFGRGTPVNNKKAEEWLQKAEKAGDGQALELRKKLKELYE